MDQKVIIEFQLADRDVINRSLAHTVLKRMDEEEVSDLGKRTTYDKAIEYLGDDFCWPGAGGTIQSG